MKNKKISPVREYKLKNGEKRFEFNAYLGVNKETGKQMRSMQRGFKSRREAELALASIKLDVLKGTYKPVLKDTTKQKPIETFEQIYNLWIVLYEGQVEESTFCKTTSIFKNHILPVMGTCKITEITIDDCQQYVNKWAVKLKNFRIVKSYAEKVLDFSIKRGYIQTNPFKLVETKIKRKSVISNEEEKENFYTKEELVHFLACLDKETNFKAYALFRLLAYSGMRKGEALALTWNDLNFTTNELRINKAISRGKDNQLYIKTTKTGGIRTIKMDEKTMGIMKEWKKRQKQDYFVLGINTMQPNQLIFSNDQNRFLQPTKTQKWLEYILKKYKLPKITTHGLRHTHCSLSFEAGVSIKEVQVRLGHSDIKTTLNIYTHVTKKAKEETIRKFAEYIEM